MYYVFYCYVESKRVRVSLTWPNGINNFLKKRFFPLKSISNENYFNLKTCMFGYIFLKAILITYLFGCISTNINLP